MSFVYDPRLNQARTKGQLEGAICPLCGARLTLISFEQGQCFNARQPGANTADARFGCQRGCTIVVVNHRIYGELLVLPPLPKTEEHARRARLEKR